MRKPNEVNILVTCEFSGTVRDEFRKLGFNAISCDLLPSEKLGPHIQGDILEHLFGLWVCPICWKTKYPKESELNNRKKYGWCIGKSPFLHKPEYMVMDRWNAIIAFPPCTHLAGSGARWWKEKQADGRQQAAIDFVKKIWDSPCDHICIENPKGILSKPENMGKPTQIIQPFHHGHEVQKTTCLWLKGFPELQPTNIVGRGQIYVDPRGQKHGGEFVNRAKNSYSPLMMLPPGQDRWKIRSRTFPGIAQAIASQWGPVLLDENNV